MHTQYSKIEEGNELQKVLSTKQNLETPENLEMGQNVSLFFRVFISLKFPEIR
jgi:hypothetical protein